MKKIALLPALLFAFGALASSASADDGTSTDPPVADPGISALRGAFAAFREARAADQACRGAQATDQCKSARAEARATLETVRTDAVVAHQQYQEKLQAWKDAKTPEEKAVIVADLKSQVEAATAVIEAHHDDIVALRGRLEDQLAKLDPKMRDQVLKDAGALEKALREKNTAELNARLHEAAAKYAPLLAQLQNGAGSGKPGTEPNGTRPALTLPPGFSLPPGFVLPKDLTIPPGLLQQLPSPKTSNQTEVHTPRPSTAPEVRTTPKPSSSPAR